MMGIDRQKTGLVIVRIFMGVFFLFEGIGKLGWNSELVHPVRTVQRLALGSRAWDR